MELFDKLGDTVLMVGKDVTQKAKDVSGIARLKFNIRSKEEFIREQYLEIGEAYYKRQKGEQIEEEPWFERIDEAFDAIAKMEQQILELRKVKRCLKCGAKAPDTAEYCSACGAKLSVEPDEEPMDDLADELKKEPNEDLIDEEEIPF